MVKEKEEKEENFSKELLSDISKLKKRFGEGSIIMPGETIKMERFSSGSMELDDILGGGYPVGRFIEIFGQESSGKTTLATLAMAEVQKAGHLVAMVDVEHAFNPEYAEQLGIDLDKLIISQPDCAEDALEILSELAETDSIKLVVLDSIAGLSSKKEVEGEMSDLQMGDIAKLMGKACRKIVPIANKTGTSIIFINQVREKIGVMYGSPETTPGGKSMKFSASIRLRTAKGSIVGTKEDPIGHFIRVETKKNKTAFPSKKAEVKLIYGQGVDFTEELINKAIKLGIVHKGGSWISYKEEKAQGVDNFRIIVDSKEELYNELLELVTKANEG